MKVLRCELGLAVDIPTSVRFAYLSKDTVICDKERVEYLLSYCKIHFDYGPTEVTQSQTRNYDEESIPPTVKSRTCHLKSP